MVTDSRSLAVYRLPVSLKWLVPPCLAQWCQIENKAVRRLRIHYLTVSSDIDLTCSHVSVVAEVRLNRTALANPVFSGLRFENLEDGSRTLGNPKERPKKSSKQHPLQRSVHMSPIVASQSNANNPAPWVIPIKDWRGQNYEFGRSIASARTRNRTSLTMSAPSSTF
jgi:hypothetical protein